MPAHQDQYTSYASRPPVDEGPSLTGYLAIAMSWLVPGSGHFLIGEKARGVVFLLTIHVLFGLGLLFGGIRSINPAEQPIWTYTQYLAGWPMLVANYYEKNDFERLYLVPLTAPPGEISPMDRAYTAEKPAAGPNDDRTAEQSYAKKFIGDHPLFAYHPKIHDMGSVYCGIAGMLNLLVMFDVLLRVTGSKREDPQAAKNGQAAAAGGAK